MAKTRDEINRKLRSFIDLLKQNYRLEAVVLFGSHVGGNPGEYSDIDVAVFSEDFGGNPLDEMTRLCRLRRAIDTDIEALPFPAGDYYSHSPAEFVHEIVESGKLIYKDGRTLI